MSDENAVVASAATEFKRTTEVTLPMHWIGHRELELEEIPYASESLAELKRMRKQIEERRKYFIGPAQETIKRINAEAKPHRDRLDHGITHITSLLRGAEKKVRELAVAKVAEQIEEAEAKGATQLALEIAGSARQNAPLHLKGLQARKNRTYQVTDMVALCRAVAEGRVSPEMVLPNTKALNAAAKGAVQPDIDGVEFVTETIFAAV